MFLIGYMGVGKSTLGKKLALRLGMDFFDSDHFIEKQVGMTVADYFARFGEEQFRKLEHEFILQLEDRRCVVATGGGLPCFHNNMQLMNERGITLYLQRPPKELFQRLRNAKKERPLLAGLSDEDLLGFINDQLKDREYFYLKAKLIVPREDQNVDFIYKKLSHE